MRRHCGSWQDLSTGDRERWELFARLRTVCTLDRDHRGDHYSRYDDLSWSRASFNGNGLYRKEEESS